MAKKRLIWVDALKGLLILLVILGHAIQKELGADCEQSRLWNIIYSFHMPAFMAVSGWLVYGSGIASSASLKWGGVLKFLYKKMFSTRSTISYLVGSCISAQGRLYGGESFQYSIYA